MTHRVEESARVYLVLDEDGRWRVDVTAVDGCPLDGLPDGPDLGGCDCETQDGHRAAARSAPRMPTAEELLGLLADALGKVCIDARTAWMLTKDLTRKKAS